MKHKQEAHISPVTGTLNLRGECGGCGGGRDGLSAASGGFEVLPIALGEGARTVRRIHTRKYNSAAAANSNSLHMPKLRNIHAKVKACAVAERTRACSFK